MVALFIIGKKTGNNANIHQERDRKTNHGIFTEQSAI